MASTIAPIATYLASTERARLDNVIPESLRKVWATCDVPGSLIASFIAQTFLTITGKKRKWAQFFLTCIWICYIVGEWAANLAIDMIFSRDGESSKTPEDNAELMGLWATFMIVHLGGSHSITAYAMEDNALWIRTLVFLSVQSARVFYVVLSAWRNTALSGISILMLIVGLIKCGERVCALRSATIDRHRDTLLRSSNNEETEQREAEIENIVFRGIIPAHGDADEQHPETPNSWELLQYFMRFFMSLFADVVYSNEALQRRQGRFRKLGEAQIAFRRVKVELGYAFDIFYTKASVRDSRCGLILRLFTLFITTIALVFFIFKVIPSYELSEARKNITYMLLVGALIIEIYAICDDSLYSKWIHRPCLCDVDRFLRTDLLTLCIRRYYLGPLKILGQSIPKMSETSSWRVTENLKSHIFDRMRGRRWPAHNYNELIQGQSIDWTRALDFHQSILTWHVSTSICYNHLSGSTNEENIKREICKTLSDYMFYLLVYRRFMLPVGTGLMGFRDILDETQEFLQDRNILRDARPWSFIKQCFGVMGPDVNYGMLLEVTEDVEGRSGNGSANLADGRRLARSLMEMDEGEMWRLIADVWVGMLGHAAMKCRADYHAKQLGQGGEFLTQVWFLMAHLGLLEQFHVTTPQNDEPATSNP